MANSVVELLFKFITSGGAEIDKTAAGVDKLIHGAARGSAPIDNLGRSLRGLLQDSKATGESLRNSLENPLQSIIQKMASGTSGLALFAGGAAGIATGMTLAAGAMKSFVQQTSEAAFEIRGLAASTGLTIGQADKLRAVAKLSGFDIRNLQEASLDLSIALKDAGGQGETSRQLLRQLGVSAYTASGQVRPLGDVFSDVFDKLSRVSDLTERVNLSRVLGGEDAAKKSQILISQYAELNQKAAELGFGTRDGLLKSLEDSNKELKLIDLQWEKTKALLAAGVAIPLSFVSKNIVGLTAPPGAAGKREPIDYSKLLDGFDFNPLKLKGASPDTETFNPLGLFDSVAAGKKMAADFRAGQSGSEDGIRLRLAQLSKDRAQVNLLLSSGDVAPDQRGGFEKQLAGIVSEADRLEQTLKRIQERKASLENLPAAVDRAVQGYKRIGGSEFELFEKDLALKIAALEKQGAGAIDIDRVKSAAAPERGRLAIAQAEAKEIQRRSSTNRNLLQSGFSDFAPGVFLSPESDRREAGTSEDAKTRFAAEMDSLKRKFDLITATNEADIAAAVRLAELGDNEYDAAALVRDIKLSTAKTVLESRQAELDYTVKIAEIDKARLDKYKDTAAQVFRSIRQRGGGGVRDLLTGQLDIQGEKIFANVSGAAFEKAGSTLGRIGAAIPGGEKIFEGTIFDPKNQKPLDKNTASLDRVTVSLDKLRAGINGGGSGGSSGLLGSIPVPGGGTLADFASDLGGLTGTSSKSGGSDPIFGKLFGGNKSSASSGFFGGVGSVPGGLFKGIGGDFSVRTGDGSATTAGTAGRIGNVAGSAAAVAAGVMGVISGLKEGGARGATGAIGSALGVASLIPGPQQPFIMTAAIVANLVKGLIPSGKETFDREQNNTLAGRKFTAPESMERAYDFATGGDSVDADYRGRMRVTVNKPIVVNVSAMDARSFLDRRDDIADAVGSAMDKGHPVGISVQKVVFGQAG